MKALDTNVLVRLLVNDDAEQAKRAHKLIDSSEAFFVPLTVCLELEWVLRGVYELDKHRVANCVEALLSIRNVSFEFESQVQKALEHYLKGVDFADALHLTASSRCNALQTFDKAFVKRARQLELATRVELV